MYRIAIFGSRMKYWSPKTAARAREWVFNYVGTRSHDVVIISGDSPGGGVDLWARDAASFHRREFIGHPPTKYTVKGIPFVRACFMRNQDIADACTSGVVLYPAELGTPTSGSMDTVHRIERQDKLVQKVGIFVGM